MIKLGKSLAAGISIALAMWSTSPVTAGFGQPGHQVSGSNHSLPSSYQVARIELPERYQGTIEYAFGAGATRAVTKPLTGASGQCLAIPAAYRASCAAAAFKRAARAANKPDYRTAKSALNKASRDLSKLVSQNADKQAPPLKINGETYKAVKKEAIPKVNKKAIKIIVETETKLLRSSGSGERKVHYQRIAQAVGSTKKIFRS